MATELESFLFKEENSRTKESLVNYQLFYDLKFAAALRGYDLSLFTPDVKMGSSLLLTVIQLYGNLCL